MEETLLVVLLTTLQKTSFEAEGEIRTVLGDYGMEQYFDVLSSNH